MPSWDIYIDDTGSNSGAPGARALRLRSSSGDGARIMVFGDISSNIKIGITTAPDFATGNGALLASTVSAVANSFHGHTWYTVDATLTVNANGTTTINANVSLGSAQLASVSTTGTPSPLAASSARINGKGDDALSLNYDPTGTSRRPARSARRSPTSRRATSLTFVNDLGEESAPSLPSSTILRPDGVSVAVTTPTGEPTGISGDYFITTKRIYRAATGSTGTAFRFVAEIPLSQATYTDTLTDSELGEVLPSDIWALPPSDLRGILALPNGVMVGFRENATVLPVHRTSRTRGRSSTG